VACRKERDERAGSIAEIASMFIASFLLERATALLERWFLDARAPGVGKG
jgi:hypothetical protein